MERKELTIEEAKAMVRRSIERNRKISQDMKATRAVKALEIKPLVDKAKSKKPMTNQELTEIVNYLLEQLNINL
jgi:hypothetical protein